MTVTTPSRASTFPPAELDRRFYACAIDRSIAWTIGAAGVWVAYLLLLSEGRVVAGLLLVVGVVLLVGLGFAIPLGLLGITPGKALLGLRVVRLPTGDPIGVGHALLRSFVLGASALPTFGLGLATLAWTAVMDPGRQRRGWHDQVAGSIVVDVRPAPVVDERVEEAPRQIVNLTAMRLVPASAPAPVVPPARPAVAARPATAQWRVTFDSGEELLVEGLALVGRRPEPRPGEPVRHLVPLPSADMSLSKTHAQFQVSRDGVLVVMDRGSTNGSVLVRAGVARDLPAGRPATLLPGDVVRLGDRRMTVARES